MMLCLWLLASVVHGCLGGGIYPTSAVSSVEAHGPLARLALHPHYGHEASVYHLPTVAQSSHEASVYHLPTVAQSSYVTPVYHLPQVADVQYTTQPRYVQRLVDVANSKVAIAKLQVKRPAIQKHFYDIEERTIVRPVGSAVLELEEPVSKKFVSPFSVVSTGHHATSQFHQPLLYPVGSYPLLSYRPLPFPVQHYPTVPVQQTPQSPQQYPVVSQPPQQFPSFSQPPQQYPSTSEPPQQVPTIPQFPQDSANTQPRPPQEFQFASQPSPSPDDSFNTEFDSSDSVVVDNPDFTKSIKSNDEPQEDSKNEDSFNEFEREVLQAQNKETEQEKVVQNIINDFENLQLLRMLSSQTGNEKPLQRSQQRPNFQVLLEPPKILEQPQQIQKKPLEETQSFQKSKESGLGNSHVSTQTESSVETSSASSSQRPSSSSTESELPALYRSYLRYLQDDQINAAKSHSSDEVIPSVRRFRPEESQENQRKLLELLTGGGEVSEVGQTRSGGPVVRGRVLSVTPAPCADGEERVNTRRVVVSRPVHTVEEVDVQRPFTHVERVAVHQPVHTLTPVLYH